MFAIRRQLKVGLHFPNLAPDIPPDRAAPPAQHQIGVLVGGIRVAAVVTAGVVLLAGCSRTSTTPTTSQATSAPTSMTSLATSPPTSTSTTVPTVTPDRLGSILLTPRKPTPS